MADSPRPIEVIAEGLATHDGYSFDSESLTCARCGAIHEQRVSVHRAQGALAALAAHNMVVICLDDATRERAVAAGRDAWHREVDRVRGGYDGPNPLEAAFNVFLAEITEGPP